jgi:hypothetical protein
MNCSRTCVPTEPRVLPRQAVRALDASDEASIVCSQEQPVFFVTQQCALDDVDVRASVVRMSSTTVSATTREQTR